MEREPFNTSILQRPNDPNKMAEVIEEVITHTPVDKLTPEVIAAMANTLWKLKL